MNKVVWLLVIKNITQLIRFKQIELESHFNELLTATVSHEMRTPLNSMLALLGNLGRHIIPGDNRGMELLKII